MTIEFRHQFRADHELAQTQTRAGVLATTARSADRQWEIWTQFCAELGHDPLLADHDDPVMVLQVFAVRLRDGRCSKSGKPLRAGSVSTGLRDVGQTMALMGALHYARSKVSS